MQEKFYDYITIDAVLNVSNCELSNKFIAQAIPVRECLIRCPAFRHLQE